VKIRKDSSFCPCQRTVHYFENKLPYIVNILESYSSKQDTLSVNHDTNLKKLYVICFMHMHEVMNSTTSNIRVTKSCAKTVNVKGSYLI
jgi:hypothetical protein